MSKTKQRLLQAGLALSAALMLAAGFFVLRELRTREQASAQFSALSDQLSQQMEALAGDGLSAVTPAELYGGFAAQNRDLVGWISIEGTALDYPVMQTPDRPNHYLRRAFDGSRNLYGVPYAQENCLLDGSRNIILYGHRTDDGTLFTPLLNYADFDFWQQHRYIRFDTLTQFQLFEVFAAFPIVSDSSEPFQYQQFVNGSDSEFWDYVENCRTRSVYDTGVAVDANDQLLTLSTCERSQQNGRMVVVARRVQQWERGLTPPEQG